MSQSKIFFVFYSGFLRTKIKIYYIEQNTVKNQLKVVENQFFVKLNSSFSSNLSNWKCNDKMYMNMTPFCTFNKL